MCVSESAGAFILTDKTFNSDSEKENWKGLDCVVPAHMKQ